MADDSRSSRSWRPDELWSTEPCSAGMNSRSGTTAGDSDGSKGGDWVQLHERAAMNCFAIPGRALLGRRRFASVRFGWGCRNDRIHSVSLGETQIAVNQGDCGLFDPAARPAGEPLTTGEGSTRRSESGWSTTAFGTGLTEQRLIGRCTVDRPQTHTCAH